MPRNGKEGILFSFVMSGIMIYVMAALNYGVRTGDIGGAAWLYALKNFPLAFVVGMLCDLCLCTPLSRKIMNKACKPSDRAVWKGLVVKFCMVVLMTACMTLYGVFASVGFGVQDFAAFFSMFPYNFTIALPIQMIIVAPLAGKIVHAVGDKFGWNEQSQAKASAKSAMPGATCVADVMDPDVYSISENATVLEAMKVLGDKKISGMPVVAEDNTVVGFVSDSDVLRTLSRNNAPVSDMSTLLTGLAKNEMPEAGFEELLEKNVMDVATPNVECVERDSTVEDLCELFGYKPYKKVPVVEDGKLVGVVVRSDLIRNSVNGYLEQAEVQTAEA